MTPDDDGEPNSPDVPGMTRSYDVEPPAEVGPAPVELGRLGPPLQRLAAAQGGWPPRRPHAVGPGALTGTLDDGADAADRLVDAGADLVVVAGSGSPQPALVALAVLLGLEPVAAVGTTGTPDWAAQVGAVRVGLRAARAHLDDLRGLLRAVGADEVAAGAGLVAQCAVRRTPVLLSGAPGALAAAVAADRLAPGTAPWLLLGCSSPAGAGSVASTTLRLEPLLDLRLALPEGADLALQVLLSAVDLARRATAGEHLSGREPAGGPPAGGPPAGDA